MKSRDKKEMFAKNENELVKSLKEAKDELLNLNLELRQNKLKNTRQIFWKKKEIALVLTALKEKKLSQVSGFGKSAGAVKGKGE